MPLERVLVEPVLLDVGVHLNARRVASLLDEPEVDQGRLLTTLFVQGPEPVEELGHHVANPPCGLFAHVLPDDLGKNSTRTGELQRLFLLRHYTSPNSWIIFQKAVCVETSTLGTKKNSCAKCLSQLLMNYIIILYHKISYFVNSLKYGGLASAI